MDFNLSQILPEEITDQEAAHLADILMNLALAVESHYYVKIARHSRVNSLAKQRIFEETLSGNQASTPETPPHID